MKLKILFISTFILSVSLYAQNEEQSISKAKVLSIAYYVNFYGTVHQNPNKYSGVQTTIACGHPVKIIEDSVSVEKILNTQSKTEQKDALSDVKPLPDDEIKNWHRVLVGPYEGYILRDFLSNSRPECFQDIYPKFFENLELDITELYYWGRLYDQILTGKSRMP